MAAPLLTPDPLHVDLGRVAIDEPLLRRLHARLFDPDTATAALQSAGALAVREPVIAAMIAERVRADHGQWRHEVHLPLSAPRTTIDWAVAARAVERAACMSLAPSAMLELEERGGADPCWASALVATAGDHGKAHLARMRSRPRWSALSPTPPSVGLDALVSPIADVRAVALNALATAPRREHLRALLLAMELDRHIIRDVLRAQWTRPRSAAWLSILATHPAATRLDRRLARLPPGAFDFAATRSEFLLVDLFEAGAERLPLAVHQELTPSLRELEARARASARCRGTIHTSNLAKSRATSRSRERFANRRKREWPRISARPFKFLVEPRGIEPLISRVRLWRHLTISVGYARNRSACLRGGFRGTIRIVEY
ncbi:hypothetical protein BH09MYX1_BH09MYX1_65410 [soil metagenome]